MTLQAVYGACIYKVGTVTTAVQQQAASISHSTQIYLFIYLLLIVTDLCTAALSRVVVVVITNCSSNLIHKSVDIIHALFTYTNQHPQCSTHHTTSSSSSSIGYVVIPYSYFSCRFIATLHCFDAIFMSQNAPNSKLSRGSVPEPLQCASRSPSWWGAGSLPLPKNMSPALGASLGMISHLVYHIHILLHAAGRLHCHHHHHHHAGTVVEML